MYYKCRISQGVPLRLMHHTLLLSLKLMTVSTPPFFLPQGLKLGKKVSLLLSSFWHGRRCVPTLTA